MLVLFLYDFWLNNVKKSPEFNSFLRLCAVW